MAVTYINLKSFFESKKFSQEIKVEVNEEFLNKYGITVFSKVGYGANIMHYDPFNRKMVDFNKIQGKYFSSSKIEMLKTGNYSYTDLYHDKRVFTRAGTKNYRNETYSATLETVQIVKDLDIKYDVDIHPHYLDKVFHYGYEYEQIINEDSLEIIQHMLLMKHGEKENIFKKVKRQSVKILADFNNLTVYKTSFSGSGARQNIVRAEQGDSIFFDTRPSTESNSGYSTITPSMIPFDVNSLISNGNKIWKKLGMYLKNNKPVDKNGIINVTNPFIIIRDYKEKEGIISQIEQIQKGSLYDNQIVKDMIKANYNKNTHKAIRDIFGFTKKMEDTISSNKLKYVGVDIGDSSYEWRLRNLGNMIRNLRQDFGDISHDEIFNDENFEAYIEYAEEVTVIVNQLRRNHYASRVDATFSGYLETYKFARKARISFIDFMDYIKGLIWGEGIYSLNDAKTLLNDYWRMAHALNMNVKRFPDNLKANHDKINIRYSFLIAKDTDKALNIQYEPFKVFSDKNYVMTFPASSGDLISEGSELGHCVGSYVTRVAEGKTHVFFLRKQEEPDKSYCTIELRDGKIIQMKLKSNQTLNNREALDFVDKWANKIKAEVVGK